MSRGYRLNPRVATSEADIIVQVDAMVAEAQALGEDVKGVITIQIIDNKDGSFIVRGRTRKRRAS